MRRDEVVKQLKAEQARLVKLKVKSLAVFGSITRDEAKPTSDIDVLVEFDGPATFDRYMDVKIFLEDLLHCPVDLVTRKGIRPELAPSIEREAIRVA